MLAFVVALLRALPRQRCAAGVGVSIAPAPDGFVGAEDLERGERCAAALWATDDDGALLVGTCEMTH